MTENMQHQRSDCHAASPPATRKEDRPKALSLAPAALAATARAVAAAAAGTHGEREAERFLVAQRGFAILARNLRSPRDRRDELDLVARDGDVLVFIEVKTRAASSRVPGYFAIGGAKKAAVRRAARAYLAAAGAGFRTFRFDVVEVTVGEKRPRAPLAWSAGGRGPAATNASTVPAVLHFENIPLFTRFDRAGR
jgi:putative endonuclease